MVSVNADINLYVRVNDTSFSGFLVEAAWFLGELFTCTTFSNFLNWLAESNVSNLDKIIIQSSEQLNNNWVKRIQLKYKNIIHKTYKLTSFWKS